MEEADVLTLGAGPAGTASAILCAQAGLQAFVVERAPFPRHRPGETLHPGVETLLRQLNVWDELNREAWLRHTGHWAQWGEEAAKFEAFGSDAAGAWQGFQVERSHLDSLLLAEARRLGVRVLQPCQLQGLFCENGRIAGVHTSQRTLRARYVIDATGQARWLARQRSLTVSRHSPALRARYGYAIGNCPERDEAPLWQGDATGWTWTARVRPNQYHWTRLWFEARAERNTPSDWQPEAFRALTPPGQTRGVDVTWRQTDAPAGPGYFLVGDAAFVLDPAASHGVLKALMSGMMAAHTILRILRDGSDPGAAQRAYTMWLHRGFATDAAKLSAIYRALCPGWGEDVPLCQG